MKVQAPFTEAAEKSKFLMALYNEVVYNAVSFFVFYLLSRPHFIYYLIFQNN